MNFQPHCHQRAEPPASDGLPSGAGSTVALLRAFGFEDVEVIDAGCCGMAGTFGYEAEHYELSRQVGEQRLFPYIEQAMKIQPDARFLSSGSACRLQIEQGTEADVEHPLVFLSHFL